MKLGKKQNEELHFPNFSEVASLPKHKENVTQPRRKIPLYRRVERVAGINEEIFTEETSVFTSHLIFKLDCLEFKLVPNYFLSGLHVNLCLTLMGR